MGLKKQLKEEMELHEKQHSQVSRLGGKLQ